MLGHVPLSSVPFSTANLRDEVVALTGVAATTSLGNESLITNNIFSVTGVSASAVLGPAKVSIPAVVAPEGVSASAVLNRVFIWGTLVPSANENWVKIQPSNSVNWRKINA